MLYKWFPISNGMKIEIQKKVSLRNFNTFKISAEAEYFAEINSIDDLKEALEFSEQNKLQIFVLGGGSNILISDSNFEGLVLKINIKGVLWKDRGDTFLVIAGAGEVWDELVAQSVKRNLYGLENLSGIPGSVGGAPVQNIGAYGAEIKNVLKEVEVFDKEKKFFLTLSNDQCKFGYRDSIFKGEARGKYIITGVTYRLSKSIPRLPDYPGIKSYFIDNNINIPTLAQIREAIISIRQSKLPNPNEIPNVGSFFKNPIVDKVVAHKIKEEYPDAKFFPIDDTHTKVPAGWLIENAGLKGKSFGKVSMYDKNALVLVNKEGATCEDVIRARDEIIKIVKDKFGIELVQEPEIL